MNELSEKCWNCDGDGKDGKPGQKCTSCGGTGETLTDDGYALYEFIRKHVMPMVRTQVVRAIAEASVKEHV